MTHPCRTLCLAFLLALAVACNSGRQYQHQDSAEVRKLIQKTTYYPEARFIVLTDPHYFDPELGISGNAFQAYLDKDRKLLAESREILVTAVAQIEKEKADFVIVSGDLTKDGEKLSHRRVAELLQRVMQSGKNVFVVPGNHDILNGEAVGFSGDDTYRVENVTPEEFVAIYEDFGYAASLDRDAETLSYLAEPVPGLWLLALDGCLWRKNKPGEHPLTGAAFSDGTLHWIESTLIRARQQNKAVIATLHHGIMEHYPANQDHYAEYLVDDHERLAELLAAWDVKLVFTGHFHAQDVSRKEYPERGKVIYDIETGSLVTSPCPYRIVELTFDQQAVIESRFIDAIPSHPADFKPYREQYLFDGTLKLVDAALKKYWVSAADRERVRSQIAKAYTVHLAGDEIRPEIMVNREGLGLWGRIVLNLQGDLIEGWYTDLPPADNRLTINLQDGSYRNN